jgi:probable phosphoglycerate mutase
MKLLLARHGNTFAPGQKVVWTGGNYDIPLVEKGRQQAKTLAAALAERNIVPADIYCGSLKRTCEHAEIIALFLKLQKPPIIDDRLNEIDYGNWTGLSSEEIEKKYGKDELNAWNTNSIWPKNAGWSGTEQATINEIIQFTNEITPKYDESETVLVVSSNGKLRYFLKLIPEEFEKRINNQTFKVKTGNVCSIIFRENLFRLEFWNESSDTL